MADSKVERTREAYRWCRRLASSHYENFPVASWLLPASMRDPVAAIYAFARIADDIADEGDASARQRHARLNELERRLFDSAHDQATPLFLALADARSRHHLPLILFRDLLDAFRQDIDTRRYQSIESLLDYCRISANPVGRLLLHLSNKAAENNLNMSDSVCTALQLINVLQDIEEDYHQRDRIYLPQDEMRRFGVTEDDIAGGRRPPALQALIRHRAEHCRQLLDSGGALPERIGGRLSLELRAVLLGAQRVLVKLGTGESAVRPRLNRREQLLVLVHTVLRQVPRYPGMP